MAESWLDIAAAWISPLLGPCRVLQTRLVGAFSTEIWRLEIETRGEQRAFALKCAVNAAQRTQVANERAFFDAAGALPELDGWLPRYFGHIAQVDGLLFGWVAGLAPFDWRQGPSPKQAKSAMAGLAALHNLTPPPGISSFDDRRLRIEAGEYDHAWTAAGETLCGYCAADESDAAEQAYKHAVRELGDQLTRRITHALGPMTRYRSLLHGDVHGENLPARGDSICMLDWADAMAGDPGVDLADFMVMSYPPALRREVEQDLIGGYASDTRCHRGLPARRIAALCAHRPPGRG